jgi:3'(2'), 5'-bisphosphate nucleotidase
VTESDASLAARVAVEAGELLVDLRQSMFGSGRRDWQVMDAGDAEAHRFIVAALGAARPGDAVLSEEGRDDPVRLTSERVWIVDPLDGTNEYGEYGRSDWAVHIALWERGVLSAGAVALPAQGLVFATDPAAAVPPSGRNAPRLVTSRFRSPPAAVMVARALDADALRMGSAGAKAMAVVAGHADIYLHDGGMYEWDSAAPVAVAAAAGLYVSRIDGSPLRYNRADPWLPDLIICRAELAEPVLDALWGNRRPYRDASRA